MNDTNNPEQQQQSETNNPQVSAHGSSSSNSRRGSNSSTSNRNNPSIALANLQANEEEEQIVTSTSSDTISTAARLPRLEALITSPARITSSTGNDCSSSPQRVLSTTAISTNSSGSIGNSNCIRQNNHTNDITTTDASSEDESQSPQQSSSSSSLVRSTLETKRSYATGSTVNIGAVYLDGAMPTTSSVSTAKKTEGQSSVATSSSSSSALSHCVKSAAVGSTTRAAAVSNISISNLSNGNLESNSNGLSKMVARETSTLAGGSGVSVAAGTSTAGAGDAARGNGTEAAHTSSMVDQGLSANENHKIILKLPKPLAPCSAQNNESHANDEPISSSGSNSNSSNSECVRKVEPLKINLHTHHSLNVVPKITIKPIVKQNDTASSDCSSSAEDDGIAETAMHCSSSSNRLGAQIPKLTIKSSTIGGDGVGNEPHIVPKLTIRSANEDGGTAHTSIVPKLTIKMSDTQMGSLSNSQSSPTVAGVGCASSAHSSQKSFAAHSPPPLPKLTIKTSLDGTSESIISTISPASSSSSSSSASSIGVSSLSSVTTSCTVSNIPSTSTTVPKLMIKTVPKLDEIVPKLTIKTNASGSCVSTSSTVEDCGEDNGASSSKIPKLTIKTGQEHAVIITQHNDASNAQVIPKLTIKTKSLDVEESLSDPSEDPPPEKIPKITIKTNEAPADITTQKFCIKTQQQQSENDMLPIPKLTISVSNLESGGAPQSPKQSPLVVRQLSSSSRKPESPERLPKLMISRQEASVSGNNCEMSDKVVPKLTIKTNNLDTGECREKQSKFAIKHNASHEEEKIPKLTIKQIPNVGHPSSEESDECLSGESSPTPSTIDEPTNKVVPKLTIKNLSSPKLKMKAVLEDKSRGGSSHTSHTASKKCVKPSDVKNVVDMQDGGVECGAPSSQKTTMNPPAEGNAPENMVNGESSSSQEFCGFNNDTTTESNGERGANMNQIEAENQQMYRHADDMDIDGGAQVFNNVTHFGCSSSEPFIVGSGLENDADSQLMQPPKHPDDLSLVVDTVDLTSSPSPGSSPAHFTYTDADPQIMPMGNEQQRVAHATLLMERLRETSVIQAVPPVENTSFLLSQLTAPLDAAKYGVPPPLQPKPSSQQQQKQKQQQISNSVKYPQLTERLMANGARVTTLNSLLKVNATNEKVDHVGPHGSCATMSSISSDIVGQQQKVIDSIEILDTPEGSPRSAMDDATAEPVDLHMNNDLNNDISIYEENRIDVLHRNNNIMDALLHHREESEALNQLKRRATVASGMLGDKNVNEHCMELTPNKVRRIDSESHTMATLTILTNDELLDAKLITTSPTIIGSNHCVDISNEMSAENELPITLTSPKQQAPSQPIHRSRKQRHEHLLSIPIDEEDPLQYNSNDGMTPVAAVNNYEKEAVSAVTGAAAADKPVVVKRRGRPKKNANNAVVLTPATPMISPALPSGEVEELPPGTVGEYIESLTPADRASKSRRVQLLRKRLAIDMVDAEQPSTVLDEVDRGLRNAGRISRRTLLPVTTPPEKLKSSEANVKQRKRASNINNLIGMIPFGMEGMGMGMSVLNHYGGSNSSLSSACSSSSLSSTTVTTTGAGTGTVPLNSVNAVISLATQIDLTMCSSSSSASNGSTTATVTTVGAGISAASSCISQSQGANSMLPPTTILSSSDPVPDVVFRPNDFSSLMVTQQLRATCNIVSTETDQLVTENNNENVGLLDAEDMTIEGSSSADISGDDSTNSSTSLNITPGGRGRGRGGRGSRGGRGNARGVRAHRLGRGASAVAKAIALSRPRCIGGLKHTPDPDRLKGLFSPSPQVFEEDTRMSADLNQTQIISEPPTPIRQADFLNNDESQSSVMSTSSILDPNTVPGVQNGSTIKRPKKKKMEVCISEEADFTVASIAEYEWPPPKGCCPSKNRDAFMIQEQVAQYLGIKSFKRKYPDLPRRQIDMEERNWLQEKALVSEKMCDLGITAVWASDILDIMYTDFYGKYEEYKDFVRQKHLREIEAKQKALGLNVLGRGLQARDRAMLSASKWNAYFNRTRKDERLACIDLQTLTINVPLPSTAPTTTLVNRPVAEAVAAAAKAENIPEPPTLLQPRNTKPLQPLESSYPVALVPGQYSTKYRHYTPPELNSLPLSTVLDDPCSLAERLLKQLDTSKQNISDESVENKRKILGESVEMVDVVKIATYSNSNSSTVRFPVRRSRRARTAASMRCDSLKREVDAEEGEQTVKSEDSSSDSSSSDESSSETDSESDSNESSAASSSSEEDEETPSICEVCQRPQNRNLKNTPELFIRCYTCRRKVHPSCIEMPHRMVARVRNYNWQCVDCKCCIRCKRKQDQNKMLFCEQCDRGFHIYCLSIKSVPDGRWSCERCSVCMRCGATKPEGLPHVQQTVLSPSGEKIKQIKHKKVKWINEYRIDHITKLREHCSMLCVPCGRAKTTKRVQIGSSISGGCSGNAAANALPPSVAQQSQITKMQPPTTTTTAQSAQQMAAAVVTAAAATAVAATATATEHHIATVVSASATTAASSTTTSVAKGTLPPPPVVA